MMTVFNFNNKEKKTINIQKPIDATLQVDQSKTALEEIGILCDGIDKSDAVGSEFFKDDSSDTLELYHAKDTNHKLISTGYYKSCPAESKYS